MDDKYFNCLLYTSYVEVENMHTIIGFLKKDCGISFMYKVAVEEELKKGILKEIQLSDFKMQHDFDFIWEKGVFILESIVRCVGSCLLYTSRCV